METAPIVSAINEMSAERLRRRLAEVQKEAAQIELELQNLQGDAARECAPEDPRDEIRQTRPVPRGLSEVVLRLHPGERISLEIDFA